MGENFQHFFSETLEILVGQDHGSECCFIHWSDEMPSHAECDMRELIANTGLIHTVYSLHLINDMN